jgi:hypothetical protein
MLTESPAKQASRPKPRHGKFILKTNNKFSISGFVSLNYYTPIHLLGFFEV